MTFTPIVVMVVNPLPEVVLRCTTKLVSSLELSLQLRLILLDEVVVKIKPEGAVGIMTGGESVVAKASLEKPESPTLLVA